MEAMEDLPQELLIENCSINEAREIIVFYLLQKLKLEFRKLGLVFYLSLTVIFHA